MATCEALLLQCGQLLGDPAWSMVELTDFATASRVLNMASNELRAALGGDGWAMDRLLGADSPHELLDAVSQFELKVARAEVAHMNSSMRRAREALTQLEQVTSVDELVNLAPAAAGTIGFDRTLLSHLEDSTWLTDAAHVDGDAEWADLIVSAGQAAPEQVLPGLPETDIVRRRKPILVTSVRKQKHVHQAVAETSAARSYVAAPITVQSEVIGFIHADRCYHRGDVNEFDAEVVGVFARGYSFALERAMALREIDEFRQRAWAFARGLDRLGGPLPGGNLAAPGDAAPSRIGAAARGIDRTEAAAALLRLTRREFQVLERMAVGEGNQAIARRLVISEETVKSHVKNILRKLCVSNRVEAVATWHAAG